MCGIVAIVHKNPNDKINFNKLRLMTDMLYHRGPDDDGYVIFYYGQSFDIKNINRDTNSVLKLYTNSNFSESNGKKGSVAFGFRRLSILDLSPLGHQPMNYLNRYWIIFNGEIYNYKELKIELIRSGYHFKSETDTEVILAAYDCWGNKCFNKFNGMWAFIIYDIEANKIIVSRDRFGIKPLYYFEDEEMLIFASEIKAIHKANLESKKVDLEKCISFLRDGDDSYSTDTVLTNIKRFPVASYYILNSINPNISITGISKYWTLSVNNDDYSIDNEHLEENLNIYRELLESSVQLRRRSDVKVGAALSGGLDSSSIVYFIMNASGSRPESFETFSNVYPDAQLKRYDETTYINILTDYLKVENHKTTPNNDLIFEDFSKMIYYADLPTHASNISGWYTYKLIKKNGVTVTLDGQGADELLAGYNSYYSTYLKDLKLSLLISEFKNSKNNYPDLHLVQILSTKSFTHLPNSLRKIIKSYFRLNKKIDLPLNKVLELDMKYNLSYLLRYGDFLSMSHSVESRLPFLDYRLVEFVFKLNQSYKISNGWTKYISRLAMNKLLPNNIVWRKEKVGWPNADDFWFGEIHKDKVKNLLTHSHLLSSILSVKGKQNLLDEKFNSRKLRALSLSVWEEKFL
jgi:asparagine synthase (glutamine-hydrolysing)